MSRDFETMYYEQQAAFTESNGMLTHCAELAKKQRDEAVSYAVKLHTLLKCARQFIDEPPEGDPHFLADIDAALAAQPVHSIGVPEEDAIAAQSHDESLMRRFPLEGPAVFLKEIRRLRALVRTPSQGSCNHKWATDGLGPTQCTRCGILATELTVNREDK